MALKCLKKLNMNLLLLPSLFQLRPKDYAEILDGSMPTKNMSKYLLLPSAFKTNFMAILISYTAEK